MDEPDPQVISAARAGDVGAFEALVRRYQGDAWRLAFQLLRDRSLADDVTQDAFVRAYRFLPRFRGTAKFSTWLFAIVRNCAVDEIRRIGRRKRTAIAVGPEDQPARDQGYGLEVREALGDLAPELREPVVLIDMFGISYAEVSKMLGVPEGTIKSRVHRARSTLAQLLGPESKEAGDES